MPKGSQRGARSGFHTCVFYRGNTTLCMLNLATDPWIPYPTAGSVWGRCVLADCRSYRGNTTLCMSTFGHRPSDSIPYCWLSLGTLRASKLSFLPREYHTLHVDFWPPTLDYITYCGSSLGSKRPAHMSFLPTEYHTLHVEFCRRPSSGITYCRPGLRTPVAAGRALGRSSLRHCSEREPSSPHARCHVWGRRPGVRDGGCG